MRNDEEYYVRIYWKEIVFEGNCEIYCEKCKRNNALRKEIK